MVTCNTYLLSLIQNHGTNFVQDLDQNAVFQVKSQKTSYTLALQKYQKQSSQEQ